MLRITSGFSFDEDGSKLFLVNTKYYHIEDDDACFRLSSGFHNMLEELIVKYFLLNSKESQLIFTSHSTNLLNTKHRVKR